MLSLLVLQVCKNTDKSPPERSTRIYITEHLLLSAAFAGFAERATLAASVKASFTPLFRIAEHSLQSQLIFS